jgi:hypothetical protein
LALCAAHTTGGDRAEVGSVLAQVTWSDEIAAAAN